MASKWLSSFSTTSLVLLFTACSSVFASSPTAEPSGSQVKVLVPYKVPKTSTLMFDSTLSRESVLNVANHVADWQLSQFDIRSNKMRKEKRPSGLPAGWMYAAFEIGLWRWSQAAESPELEQTAMNLAKLNDYAPGPRVYHADDQAMADVYLSIYAKHGGEHRMAPTLKNFKYVLDNPSTRSLDFRVKKKEVYKSKLRKFTDPWCTVRWCWADAVFMAPPVLAHLSKITGDSSYLDFMNREFWLMTDYLLDKDYQLYLRDSRYFDRKDDKGRPIFWGRGNGWVLAGLARTIEYLPDSYPKKKRYIELFKNLSAALLKYQNKDGSWPSSLLESGDDSHPETSATGLLAFALAWGVNQGILEDVRYKPAIISAWSSIVANIEPSGKVGFVQQVAFAPGSATRSDTQLYGSGAVLLAASEIYRMIDR